MNILLHNLLLAVLKAVSNNSVFKGRIKLILEHECFYTVNEKNIVTIITKCCTFIIKKIPCINV